MVDLVTASLVSAVQRQTQPSVNSTGSADNPSVVGIGSDDLTSNTQDEISTLVFGPSGGLFTDNNAFVTVAAAGSDLSGNNRNFGTDVFNLQNSRRGSLFDFQDIQFSSPEARLNQILANLDRQATAPTTIETTEETPTVTEDAVTEAPQESESSNDTASDSSGNTNTTEEPVDTGPGNSGNSNGQGNNGNGGNTNNNGNGNGSP